MTVSWWVWAALMLAVAAMLAVDLFLHRDNHVIGFREAAIWSGVWIAAGLLFGVLLWAWQGGEVAGTYYAGYLIEKALSIDNVFVFALVFSYFAVPAAYQHKVLFWGVIGALVFRLVFIFVGAELLEAFFWTAYLFGAFLIYTGYKMAFRHDEQTPPDRNPVVRLVRRAIPTDPAYHGEKFFTRVDGKRVATLLFVVLIAVEATDLIFAIDSIAAILAISTSTFIVWTANAFAILGLRSLYFCLAGLLRRFVHLHYGLAVLLAFAGVKLILSETPVGKLPIPVTLGVIVVTIAVSIIWSLRSTSGTGDAIGGGGGGGDGVSGPDTGASGARPAEPADQPDRSVVR
ncbi:MULTISPECIES: TerC family protein [unclassified Solwaraspora]|uniref:TerC family protein n=1 Tax=unclassified Solwaraspora TaxID=2627926 RepID=UPI00248B93BA|nr:MULTISPECIES: TerC family protein [unclassified Solwaraspora]WBB95931.1 TerC family protein [Solwaraspora sp. WMMA2059]WBC20165.1 TerC family protein [Solwaraspora sp. WMMA2080]WJK32248.1 TerC family protein [Solwaraspora sp. WMMA2065]